MKYDLLKKVLPLRGFRVLVATALLLATFTAIGQIGEPFVELASVQPNSGDEDLKKLSGYFIGVRIVGLGESTHGTSEFTAMRHRIFRYLVEHHGFDSFFLEADYANCLRVNRYINGADDEVKEAVSEIGLWPWSTTEMVDLVEWMRDYNSRQPSRNIKFVGVDAQQFETTLMEIDQLLEKYGLPVTDTSAYAMRTDSEFMVLKKKKDLAPYMDLVLEKENAETFSFSDADRMHYDILIRHFRQIIEMQTERKSHDKSQLRDNHMAVNVLSQIGSDPDSKGIYWAHNGHMFNLSINEFGTPKWGGSAGGYLKETMGDEYFSLGFDFDEGSFNAYYPDENGIELEKKKYVLGEVSVGPSRDGTLAANYREHQSPVFIDYAQLPTEEYFYMNHIGATYTPGNEDHKESLARYNVLGGKTSFDGMILIQKTTATHLLRHEKGDDSGDQ